MCAWVAPFSEHYAKVDGDDRGRRDVLRDAPVLVVEGVPADHFGVEQPQLIVDPFQIVLGGDAERSGARPADGPAHRNRQCDITQLPEILRVPEGVYVRVLRNALLAFPRGELA